MRRFALPGALAALCAFAFAAPALAAGGGGQSLASNGDPFAACVGVGADPTASPPGVNNPNAEVEPSISDNPVHSANLVAGWQQDRWSDGGAKGLVAGWSNDGGATWHDSVLPFSACASSFDSQVSPFDRASDPWVSFGPDGRAYGQGLVFNANDNHNGVAAVTSVDGGRTWQNLRQLIDDSPTDPTLPVDDKNSITADPNVPGVAYSVWDRISVVPCGTAGATRAPEFDDHPAIRGALTAPQVCTAGPAFFTRTTDGGRTWEKARPIVPVGINAQTIGNVIVVSRRTGTLFDLFDFIDATGIFHVQQVFSNDHGVTWSQPQDIGLLESAALQANRGGVVDPRNAGNQLRTGDVNPEPGIDPTTGRLYAVWQDARFNGGKNDQVVISTSGDPLGRTGSWTAPKLVSPAGDPAAFNPSVTVNREGQVAVLFQDLRTIGGAPANVLPTTSFVRVANGPGLDFDRELQVSRPFNILAAARAPGFFVGDYTGIAASPRTGGFVGVFGATDCGDTSCTAIANQTGAPTGGLDPSDIFTHRVAGGEDTGDSQD